jgi:hypothetical protein
MVGEDREELGARVAEGGVGTLHALTAELQAMLVPLNRGAARRMLGQIAADGTAPPEMAAGATATLVSVLLREGEVEEAERQLDALRNTLGEADAGRLTLQVAGGWIHQGKLDRAAGTLATDSTVEALALIGLIRLYRGDLAGAATAASGTRILRCMRRNAAREFWILVSSTALIRCSNSAAGSVNAS